MRGGEIERKVTESVRMVEFKVEGQCHFYSCVEQQLGTLQQDSMKQSTTELARGSSTVGGAESGRLLLGPRIYFLCLWGNVLA